MDAFGHPGKENAAKGRQVVQPLGGAVAANSYWT